MPARSSTISSTGSRKATPKPNRKRVHEVQIIADPGKRLLLHAADIALIAEQEMQRPRHGDEIGKAGAGDEEEGRHHQERQEGLLFLDVEAGRDEPPHLGREDREADHQRGEEGDLHLDEEGLENVGVDELALAGAEQRLDQKGEDRLGEIEADEEGGEQSRERTTAGAAEARSDGRAAAPWFRRYRFMAAAASAGGSRGRHPGRSGASSGRPGIVSA